MRLLIDIGNTQVKYVIHQAQENHAPTTFTEIISLEYQAFQQALTSKVFATVSEVIVANVQGNDLLTAIESWAALNNIVLLQVHSQHQAFGVTSSYQEPEKLGVDRWIAMIAAHKLYPEQNIIIVDAGTATTIDLLNSGGQHLGGWIMPGVQTMFDGLMNKTQKIIAKPMKPKSLTFGVDSSACVNYGIWAMTIAAVKEAIVQTNKLLTVDKIILTGGNAAQIECLIDDDFGVVVELIPELIFHGLSSFYTDQRRYL